MMLQKGKRSYECAKTICGLIIRQIDHIKGTSGKHLSNTMVLASHVAMTIIAYNDTSTES